MLKNIVLVLLSVHCAFGSIVTRPDIWKHPSNARLAQIVANNKIMNAAAPNYSANNRVAPIQVADSQPHAQNREVRRSCSPPVPDNFTEIYKLVEKEAPKTGISPVVIFSIMWHETGGFRSRLWRSCHNPGGIKYRCGYRRSGAYSSFDSPEDGIRAETLVLCHGRYDAARGTDDLTRQVNAISAAGYAEHSREWPILVKKYVKRFTANRPIILASALY